ncbi:MAG: hypothetical protein AAF664_14535, partial [Planctomycetota bacterium]
ESPSYQIYTRLHFVGDRTDVILLADGDNAFVIGQESKAKQTIPAKNAWPSADVTAHWFRITHTSVAKVPANAPPIYNDTAEIYRAVESGLRVVYSETRPVDEWNGQGITVGSKGTIAIQHEDYVNLRKSNGEEHRVPISNQLGVIAKFDPSESVLLLGRDRQTEIHIVDVQRGNVLASRRCPEEWSVWRAKFQDDSHLIISEQWDGASEDARREKIVRWNWRDGKEQTVLLGHSDASVLRIRRYFMGVFSVVWLALATWLARSSKEFLVPFLLLGGLATLGCVWAYCHPLRESEYLSYEVRIVWLALVVIWTSAPLMILQSGLLSVFRAPEFISLLLVMGSISANRLHHLDAEGSWFLPIALLTALAGIVMVRNVISLVTAWRHRKNQSIDLETLESGSPVIRLIDLLVLTSALAFAFAMVQEFDTFDLGWKGLVWSIGIGIVLAMIALTSRWCSWSNCHWGWRTLALVGSLGVVYFGVSRVFMIPTGALPLYHGRDFGTLLILVGLATAYSIWLFRGCDSQAFSGNRPKPAYSL